jgi:hypothetical protein
MYTKKEKNGMMRVMKKDTGKMKGMNNEMKKTDKAARKNGF